MSLEKIILNNLCTNETYMRQTIPFLKSEYFHDRNEKQVFELIRDFIDEYNTLPSKIALSINLDKLDTLNETTFAECKGIIQDLPDTPDSVTDQKWLVDSTEEFCQNKAIFNAIHQAIKIMDSKDSGLSKGAIPQILSDALGVTFDASVGHDFIEDAAARYEYYHRREERIPFALKFLNIITGGGFPKKTLNVFLAGTGVGKSLLMCDLAATNLAMGKNVLYITMEMAEERIAERIDANLLDVEIGKLRDLPKAIYARKHATLKMKKVGKLIIKEYPTSSAGAANFRHLLNELKTKKNFTPDIIYIDYINICCSSRIRNGNNVNSYTYIKAIAEELRGLAIEFNVPIVSATQTTRAGYSNSDVEITDTSESFGLPATVDFMAALIQTDQLKQLGQIMVKQLKNRYNDPETYKKFVLGIDKKYMRLYDVEDSAQEDLVEEGGPVFAKTKDGDLYDTTTGEIVKEKVESIRRSFDDFV